jgi:hypothetical protein
MPRILAIEEATTVVIPGKRGKPATDFGAIVAEFASMKPGELWIERAAAKATLSAKPNKSNPVGGFLEKFTAAALAHKPPVKFTADPIEHGAKDYYLKLKRV